VHGHSGCTRAARWQILVSARDRDALSSAATMTDGHEVGRTSSTREVLLRDRDGHRVLAHDCR
jgi:hypothetical protein